MVKSQQVQDRCMHIMDMNRVFHGLHTKVTLSTKARRPFHYSPRAASACFLKISHVFGARPQFWIMNTA